MDNKKLATEIFNALIKKGAVLGAGDYSIGVIEAVLAKATGIVSYLASFDAEELWDENNELIDDDISSLETVAGHNIMRKEQFIKVINDIINAR